MTPGIRPPLGPETKNRRSSPHPEPDTIEIECDTLSALIRRSVSGAIRDADRLKLEATALGDVVGGLAGGSEPDEIRSVAVQIRATARSIISGATELCATAERLETIAEVEELASG